jgi:hypothetical protein
MTRSRVAANSIANGTPSSLRQIATVAATCAGVSDQTGLTSRLAQ